MAVQVVESLDRNREGKKLPILNHDLISFHICLIFTTIIIIVMGEWMVAWIIMLWIPYI